MKVIMLYMLAISNAELLYARSLPTRNPNVRKSWINDLGRLAEQIPFVNQIGNAIKDTTDVVIGGPLRKVTYSLEQLSAVGNATGIMVEWVPTFGLEINKDKIDQTKNTTREYLQKVPGGDNLSLLVHVVPSKTIQAEEVKYGLSSYFKTVSATSDALKSTLDKLTNPKTWLEQLEKARHSVAETIRYVPFGGLVSGLIDSLPGLPTDSFSEDQPSANETMPEEHGQHDDGAYKTPASSYNGHAPSPSPSPASQSNFYPQPAPSPTPATGHQSLPPHQPTTAPTPEESSSSSAPVLQSVQASQPTPVHTIAPQSSPAPQPDTSPRYPVTYQPPKEPLSTNPPVSIIPDTTTIKDNRQSTPISSIVQTQTKATVEGMSTEKTPQASLDESINALNSIP